MVPGADVGRDAEVFQEQAPARWDATLGESIDFREAVRGAAHRPDQAASHHDHAVGGASALQTIGSYPEPRRRLDMPTLGREYPMPRVISLLACAAI